MYEPVGASSIFYCTPPVVRFRFLIFSLHDASISESIFLQRDLTSSEVQCPRDRGGFRRPGGLHVVPCRDAFHTSQTIESDEVARCTGIGPSGWSPSAGVTSVAKTVSRRTELTSRRTFPVNGTRVCQREGTPHLRHRDLIDRQRSTYLGQLHTHLENQRVRWELALGRDARVRCVPI
jgi:hypothetical protein